QSVEPHRVLGVVLAPFIVGDVADRLQRIVVAGGKAPFDEALRGRRRLAGAEVGGLQNSAQHPFGRDRVIADEFPVAREHAAEILRPRPVHCAVDDNVAEMPGAKFLGYGREAETGVDFTRSEELSRGWRLAGDPMDVIYRVEPDM